jgi:hypothetical protein
MTIEVFTGILEYCGRGIFLFATFVSNYASVWMKILFGNQTYNPSATVLSNKEIFW